MLVIYKYIYIYVTDTGSVLQSDVLWEREAVREEDNMA